MQIQKQQLIVFRDASLMPEVTVERPLWLERTGKHSNSNNRGRQGIIHERTTCWTSDQIEATAAEENDILSQEQETGATIPTGSPKLDSKGLERQMSFLLWHSGWSGQNVAHLYIYTQNSLIHPALHQLFRVVVVV